MRVSPMGVKVISREDAKKVGLNRQHTGGVLSNIFKKGQNFAESDRSW